MANNLNVAFLSRVDLRRVGKAALLLLVLLTLVLFAQFHYVIPDSAAYVSYVRSLLWDQDVSFFNEYRTFGMIDREEGIEFGALVKETKRQGNPFGMGTAVMWMPFVVITQLLAWLLGLFGMNVSTDGFGTSLLLAAHLGTWTYAVGLVVLIMGSLRELFPSLGSSPRRAATVGAVLGTPMIYYVLQMPSYSHVCAAFVMALLLYLSLRWREEWNLRRSIFLGATLGLAGLVRAQELGFWFLPLAVAWAGGALRGERRVVLIGAYLAAALLAFTPQLLAWNAIYGTIWHVPQGSSFLQLSPDRLWKVMLSSHHGLIAWSPIVALAIAGWVLLLRRSESRVLGAAILIGFLIQWVVNAMPIDWWAGWSFGARRFIDCVPLIAMGLAAVARFGLSAVIAIYVVSAANLYQYVRVASGSLSGEHDPGWGQLWGVDAWGFLSRIHQEMGEMASVSWTYIKVLQRPEARAPSLQLDSTAFLVVVLVLWLIAMVFTMDRVARRWGRNEG